MYCTRCHQDAVDPCSRQMNPEKAEEDCIHKRTVEQKEIVALPTPVVLRREPERAVAA